MKILTDEEIMDVNQSAEFDSAIGYARKIESAVLEKLKAQEQTANGCKCSVCGEWQKWTPSGMVCKNGHGGVMGINTALYTHPLPPADLIEQLQRDNEHNQLDNASLKHQRDELLAVLEQIVDANPRKWEELAEPQSEFERWAKSRANQAIASVKEKQNDSD